MSDLIRREDIPYIDLNSDMPQSKVRVWVAFKEQIDVLPSADAVEVVRCENCIFYEKALSVQGFCHNHESIVYVNDFCSYGERRK